MSYSETHQSLQEFISIYKKNVPGRRMHISKREQFFSAMMHHICDINSAEKHADILPPDYQGPKLVVDNAAIINDDDLLNRYDKKSCTSLTDHLDDKISLFQQAKDAMLLPMDIRGLSSAVFSFCMIGSNSKIYMHEKSISPLIEYAQEITSKPAFYVEEDRDEQIDDIRNIDPDSDVLSFDTLNTKMTYYILQRAGLKNIDLSFK